MSMIDWVITMLVIVSITWMGLVARDLKRITKEATKSREHAEKALEDIRQVANLLGIKL